MQVKPIKTRVFREGENLAAFIGQHVKKLPEASVLVVTSKIVALAEGRTVADTATKTKEALIKRESDFALPTKWVWLTLKDGLVIANAGIDESNADGKLILLPKDSFAAAAKLRTALRKHYKVKKLGVIIPDSRIIPLRAGVIAMALGYAGIRGLRDYRGKKDIFGRLFRFETTGVVDSLSTAAALVMGEGAEQQPLAVITDAPVEFTERVNRAELSIPFADDIYLPFFSKLRMPLFKKRGR
jgi:coenzyme F420-0:L-glutamate ligase